MEVEEVEVEVEEAEVEVEEVEVEVEEAEVEVEEAKVEVEEVEVEVEEAEVEAEEAGMHHNPNKSFPRAKTKELWDNFPKYSTGIAQKPKPSWKKSKGIFG